MPLIPLDAKRCLDFHTWNAFDQLEVCPGGGKRPRCKRIMAQPIASKPFISFNINSQHQFGSVHSGFFN